MKGPITGGRGIAMLVLIAATLCVHAQEEGDGGPCDKPTDKKIVKLLEEAAKEKNPTERHAKLKATQEIDPACTECLFQLGISAFNRSRAGAGSYEASIKYFEQVKAKCPEYHADLYYYLGTLYYAQDKFAEAGQAFQQFLKFSGDDPARLPKDLEKKTADVEQVMPELQFYVDFYKDQRPFNPTLMKGVSTQADEYLPMFSPDNELLFFTRLSKYQAKGDPFPRDVEELTEARRADVKQDFDKGTALPPPFNTGDSYGGVTVSVNNKEVFVTICKAAGKDYKNCDIYRTHYDTHMDFASGRQVFEWGTPEDLGPNINTPDGWESQPTLSADGRTLYFATVRKDSRGTDIYQSTRNDKGEWSPARPVPGPINTDGDEKAPFLHSDSHTLYFAAKPPRGEDGREDVSRGQRGIGGYDIFYSRMQADGSWSKPKNIGNPINTPQDEHGLIVSADGRTAYFASNRFKGAGGLDLYGFELPKDARPEDIIVVKGEVKDENGKPVTDAKVSITYMDTRKTEVLHVDEADGRYATVLRLKPGADVVVTVKKEDHVFDSRAFTAEDTARGGVAQVDMKLEKIQVGKSYRVNDIKYATNSAALTKASEYILEELITFLKENPTLRIEIQGHTDNVGGEDKNLALSNDRAFTVREYIGAHGIKGDRLTSKGYGASKPLANNDTEAGRAQNRRTEFVIIGR
ncbi:MAG: OmpA family protein [Flavobacteriales bacterium]